jgi:DNA topoisomerase-6 subunit B
MKKSKKAAKKKPIKQKATKKKVAKQRPAKKIANKKKAAPAGRRNRVGEAPSSEQSEQRPEEKGTPARSGVVKRKVANHEKAATGKRAGGAVTAQDLAQRQRDISISEFFTKNRHLLGFDNPRRALLAAVKEAVDNSLDACEEARKLPRVSVELREVGEDRFRVVVTDNGPGIVRAQIPKIFGKLLYGSKFHALKQTRGQQGIGISAAGMYGQITTGKPVAITSRTRRGAPAHYYEIQIDTRKNQPVIVKDASEDWEVEGRGTRVEIELEGRYQKGRYSVDAYLQQTALANPHVDVTYLPPKGDPVRFSRVVDRLPDEPKEIKPHPHGVELGALQNSLKSAKGRRLSSFLTQAFSRVSPRAAQEILAVSELKGEGKCHLLRPEEIERLHEAMGRTKLMAPPTDCLSPIGEPLILQSLAEQVKADFYTAVSRRPSVYRGNPFLVEAGLAYGGDLPTDQLVTLFRFANRVPLLFQQSACAMTEAAVRTDWRSYGLSQSRGALPTGPAVLLVHVASVWVPFTSESKEAVADYDEIVREIRLALQECGRKLGRFVSRRRKEAEADRKRSYIEKYIPYIGEALQEILSINQARRTRLEGKLKDLLERSRR